MAGSCTALCTRDILAGSEVLCGTLQPAMGGTSSQVLVICAQPENLQIPGQAASGSCTCKDLYLAGGGAGQEHRLWLPPLVAIREELQAASLPGAGCIHMGCLSAFYCPALPYS